MDGGKIRREYWLNDGHDARPLFALVTLFGARPLFFLNRTNRRRTERQPKGPASIFSGSGRNAHPASCRSVKAVQASPGATLVVVRWDNRSFNLTECHSTLTRFTHDPPPQYLRLLDRKCFRTGRLVVHEDFHLVVASRPSVGLADVEFAGGGTGWRDRL